MNTITYRVALEIIQHEAIVRQAYKDSVGVWTWGVGVTNSSGHNVTRYIGKPQTLKRVLEVYIWLLETKYLPSVLEAFYGINLTEEQLAAALSFHWNTGAIKKATWVKLFVAGDIAGAKSSFMNYRKPPEIIPRRKKERDLFFSGKWSAATSVTEFTRVRNNGSIDWSKSKRINIESALNQAIGISPVIDYVGKSRQDERKSRFIPAYKRLLKLLGSKK